MVEEAKDKLSHSIIRKRSLKPFGDKDQIGRKIRGVI